MRLQDITIKTQVIFVSLLTMVITLSIVLIILQIFMTQVQIQLGEFMQNLFDNETSNQLENLIAHQNRNIRYNLQRNAIKIRNIDSVFQIVQQQIIKTQVKPQDCLLNFSKSSNDSYAMTQSFCYSIFNKSSQPFQEIRNFNNLTAILTELLPITNYRSKQEAFSLIFYVSIHPAQYFISFTGSNSTGLIPQSRPWFKQHIQSVKTNQWLIQYSEPYFASNNAIYISQTGNLTFLNGSLAGVIGVPLNFRVLPQLNYENVYFYLVNLTGYVVVGDFYLTNISVLYHINQTNVTGFTNQDWLDIQKASQNQSILKLINGRFNSTVYVKPIIWKNPKYFVILFQDSKKIIKDQEKFNDQFSYMKEFYLKSILIYNVLISLAVIITQILIVLVIVKPLKMLVQLAQFRIYGNISTMNRKKLDIESMRNDTLKKIYSSYIKMIESVTSNTNSTNCSLQAIQNIQYPIRQQKFISRTRKLNLHLLNDFIQTKSQY